MSKSWSPDSWRNHPILQQPSYADQSAVDSVTAELIRRDTLVSEAEVDSLQSRLAAVANGEAFLLQGGDCAETFVDGSRSHVESLFKVILQMALVLTYAAKTPIVKVGRIGGQYAKPRSNDIETIEDKSLPVFRGDIINGIEFDLKSRTPDPQRMLKAHTKAAETIAYIRELSINGFADLHRAHTWNRDFVTLGPLQRRYQNVIEKIEDALAFMAACGVTSSSVPNLGQIDLYTSHEALLMPYESALVRASREPDQYFSGSAHMLWVGERTRQLDHAHVEFLRGIKNPIGMKVGPTISAEILLNLISSLNPTNIPGKLTLITRMGAEQLKQKLPTLIRAVQAKGLHVIWSSDPMHGNTHKSASGYKTRSFDAILEETKVFFDVVRGEGAHPGGIHLEMTGQNVTECIGGATDIKDEDLSRMYKTQCDPRLNGAQVLELAFALGELI